MADATEARTALEHAELASTILRSIHREARELQQLAPDARAQAEVDGRVKAMNRNHDYGVLLAQAHASTAQALALAGAPAMKPAVVEVYPITGHLGDCPQRSAHSQGAEICGACGGRLAPPWDQRPTSHAHTIGNEDAPPPPGSGVIA